MQFMGFTCDFDFLLFHQAFLGFYRCRVMYSCIVLLLHCQQSFHSCTGLSIDSRENIPQMSSLVEG